MIYRWSRLVAVIRNRRGLRVGTLVAAIALAGIAAAFVTGRVYGNREPSHNSLLSATRLARSAVEPAPISNRPAARSAGDKLRVETEVITLRPEGFEPASITRPQGTFILLLDNRTGLTAIQINLDGEAGGRLRQESIPRENADWSDVLDLAPGVYLLTEGAHPEWSCKLSITPK